MTRLCLIGYLLINAVSFTVFGLDKLLAIRHRRRIPEATLLMLALDRKSVV